MEIPNHQGVVDIPIPLNTSYNAIFNPTPQNHIIPTSAPTNGQTPTNGPPVPENTANNTLIVPYKKNITNIIKYKECLKNHAASIGGSAIDGCGEFMPSGEDGSIESLTCSACTCHRNFHRKEIQGDPSSFDYFHHGPHFANFDRKVLLVGPRMVGNYVGPMGSESEEEMGMPRQHGVVKKRFRTRFSNEQREKMMGFAERVGWKIQKQEESVVQEFCQEIGVKRRVLKVWMHNNKHNLAKKNTPLPQNPT